MKKRLITLFSIFIRLRDTDDSGIGTCCYCGGRIFFRTSNNCHYQKCTYEKLRFSELNCHAGHETCNNTDDIVLYRSFLIKEYGLTTVELIESTKHDYDGSSENDYANKYIELRKKVVKLASNKDFEVKF